MKNLKIINIVILGVALLVAFNIYKKQVAEVEQLKAQKETEAQKNKILKELSGYEKKISSYSGVLSAKDADEVRGSISDLARDAGVNILSLRPGEQSFEDDYSITSFTVSLNAANYQALGKFIGRLESDQGMFLVVDSLKVNRTQAGTDKALLANLKISTYSFNKE